jgi:hypothetical protein
MTDLLALAERCEAATGTDPDLDTAIHDSVDAEFAAMSDVDRNILRRYIVRKYTSSIDAALTLVPEGYWLKLSAGPKGGGVCELTLRTRRYVRDAETSALAICAAALRARAACSVPTMTDADILCLARQPAVSRERYARDALAAGTRSAETRSKAPSEGCQSGPKGNAQKVQP